MTLNASQVRTAFKALADAQPVHNIIKTWALEAVDPTFPSYALEQLAEAIAVEMRKGGA